MVAFRASARLAGAFWLAVGIAGFVLMFDSVLFVVALLAMLVGGGGGGNPYTGIFVFFVAPLGLVTGWALCWLAYEVLRARRANGAAAPRTAAAGSHSI